MVLQDLVWFSGFGGSSGLGGFHRIWRSHGDVGFMVLIGQERFLWTLDWMVLQDLVVFRIMGSYYLRRLDYSSFSFGYFSYLMKPTVLYNYVGQQTKI